jgi:hypothetical protein
MMRTSRPGQSALLMLDVVEILNREHLDYAVIGAFALSVHGRVRASTDADALLCVEFRRLERLEELFRANKFGTTLRPRGDEDPVLGMLILTDTHGNQVDLLGGLKGMDPELFSRVLEIPFGGQILRIVGREDFIAMKCFAGGPQDLTDARSAYAESLAPVDLDLLRILTRRFGREASDRLEMVIAR